MAIIPSDEKVFMVDKRTNTIYGGSAALQAMQQWYTMQDVSDSIQPYKVFTALLTQSGGVNEDINQSTGALVKGVSYQFNGAGGSNVDFRNVGVLAPVDGEYFIATENAVPANYDGWVITYNLAAPVATVLENTIGNVWFIYNADGNYQIPFDACALVGITVSNSASFISNNILANKIVSIIFDDGDGPLVQIYTTSDDATFKNGLLQNTPIEIRVYN